MSDKKKKDIPGQEPEAETSVPAAENAENPAAENAANPAEETAPETFTVTREQMEKMEGLAKLVADVNDKYLRLAAEYDNYRKRTAKEKENAYGDARADTIKPFLAVYDNLERGIAQYDESDVHRQGLELILRQFGEVLNNAVMHVEDEAAGENTVVEVFQKGFMLGDKVLRFAMVKVAN